MARKAKSTTTNSSLGTPHRQIHPADGRERFALELLDGLWEKYRQRVEYVRRYEEVVAGAGATFVNDHIAFRTIACQRPWAGIGSVARVFTALGYRAAGCYQFPDKHLSSLHYQHPRPGFPKIFVSELELWDLAPAERKTILRTLRTHREALPDETLAALAVVESQSPAARGKLLQVLLRHFHRLPWDLPPKKDVQAINQASQFAAWVLVHGYAVNHFTALVNSHQAAGLRDIEQTIQRLREAGIPMKSEIEGAPGSKLRQSATEAVVINVPVRVAGRMQKMPWTYAYFELAERGTVTNPATGQQERFEGFLGPQATQLFEMTRTVGKG